MSQFDITTHNGLVIDRWTYYNINSLTLTTEIRTKENSEEDLEYRKTLRISGEWLIKEIEVVEVPDDIVTQANQLTMRVQGGDEFIVAPDSGMGYFKLMGQDITPEQEQGTGYNKINDEWVSVADEWKDLNLTAIPDPPVHAVDYSNAAGGTITTNYTYCTNNESASVWNETREQDGVDQYRTRVRTTQFYDVSCITGIRDLFPDIYTAATLPAVGYNNDTAVGLITDPFYYPYCFVLTEFSVTPLQQLGGKMARVRYTWEIWNDWSNL